ncbi:MAG: DUF484 family protein, partial [Paracoccaceae bacterium]
MSTPKMDETLRDAILSHPDALLEDSEVMKALIAANERAMGSNIVDLRGIAMERLERRLSRLEDTHRNAIAAAYDNLASANQVHRAILRMLDPLEFEDFLLDLGDDVAKALCVDVIRLTLESAQDTQSANLRQLEHVLRIAPPGYVDSYLTEGRATLVRQVTLRQLRTGDPAMYDDKATWIRSEACLKLDFGNGLCGLLVMGSEDPHQFSPQQGTDLLAFFAGVFERAMRR